MDITELRKSIDSKTAKIAMIGLGYVGLPVACEFSRVGFDVLGIDLLIERVEKITAGISPIEGNEPGLAELLIDVINSERFSASTDYRMLSDRDVILVAVETPVDKNHIPQYRALRSALKSLGLFLKPGALVIIESTIAPGTMRDVVQPILEESSGMSINEGFYLGNCPERVMPGKLLSNLRTVSRVVGGMTPDTAETMIALYKHIVEAELDPTDCITAELVKTVENAYRDVQIAFANEVALISEAVGGDIWKVRELVNKSPGRDMLLPGAGVGGHCIPKDPWLLAYGAEGKNVPLRLIPSARAVNDSMPLHMLNLLKDALDDAGQKLENSRILVMGYAYLENSDDTRNSPSKVLVQLLHELGAEVVIHDPHVPQYRGNLFALAKGCDATVVMVKHEEYTLLKLDDLFIALGKPVLIDGRHVFPWDEIKKCSWIYRGLGNSLHG